MIVADCNLVAYLLIQGDWTAEAEAVFRHDPQWCAPFLWRSEFRNVLIAHVRQRSMSMNDAHSKMEEAEELLGQRSFAVNSTRVLEEAARRKISAYDAEYTALAIDFQVPLVTLDRKLLIACPDIAVSSRDFVENAS
jgi:predicted nucleic acid-binding protein